MARISKLINVLRKINQGLDLTKAEIIELNGFGSMSFLLQDWTNSLNWSKSDKKDFKCMPELVTQLVELSNNRQIKFESLQNDIRNSVLSSYYTPPIIIEALVTVLRRFAIRTGESMDTILEPAAGSGRFFEPLCNEFPKASISAVEKNSIAALVAQQQGRLISDKIKVFNNVFEAMPYDKRYDLIISNIPFAKVKVVDANIPKSIKDFTGSLHEFYFAKSLQLLRADGILAFITTTGVMDSATHTPLREYMVRNANLISAVRLPDNVFTDENTRVTSDVIILQKVAAPKRRILEHEKLFIKSPTVDLFSSVAPVNPYYLTYDRNVIGELRIGNQYSTTSGSTVINTRDDLSVVAKDMAAIMDASMSVYAQTFYQQEQSVDMPNIDAEMIEDSADKPKLHYEPGQVDIDVEDRVGNYIYREYEGHLFYLEILEQFDRQAQMYPCAELVPEQCIQGDFLDKEHLMQLLIRLRSASMRLLQYKTQGLGLKSAEYEFLRVNLNTIYDDLRAKTAMSLTQFLRVSKYSDVDVSFMAALEIYENGRYEKADIFKERFVKKEKYRTADIWDAIRHSYNHTGGVDVELCTEVLQMDTTEFISRALEEGYLKYDISEDNLCLPNTFLSGNISEKITAHHNMIGGHKPDFLTDEQVRSQLLELEQVKPAKVPVENIRPQIGEMMFNTDLYSDFWLSFLTVNINNRDRIKVIRNDRACYKVIVHKSLEQYVDSKLSIRLRGKSLFTGIDMMEAVLNNEAKYFTYKTDDGKIVPDYAANNTFVQSKERIKIRWQEYYMTSPQARNYIENTYYDSIGFVPKQADGRYVRHDELTAAGITPYPYQLAGSAMLVENNGGLEQQPTGGGKTITMLMTAMRLKQCGIAQKPMICGLIANIDEIYQTAKKVYPNAKILYADKGSFQDRRAFMAKIANNNWDLILMSHSQFSRIPQHKETVLEILHEELKNIEDEIMFIQGVQDAEKDDFISRLTKRQLKGLEIRKANKAAEIAGWLRTTTDTSIDILKLGIDHIMVDEAHYFKNLSYSTRHRNIAGLNPKGSQRAGLLYMNVRAIRNRYYNGEDKGLTFVTATPIQNYVAEQYTLDRLFNMQRLKRQGIANFDAYMHTFFDVSQAIELTVTNQFVTRTRIRGYIKLDLLRKMAREYTHIVTKSAMEQHVKSLPKSNIQFVKVPRNEEQKQYLYDLLEFAGGGDRNMIQRNPDRNEADGAEMLLASTYANLASIDMRLVDADVYVDYCQKNSDTKINEVCRHVANIYKQENDQKGTQLLFCNEGVPGGTNFNLYDAMRQTLVTEYGIPHDEIQFVHDSTTDTARDKLRNQVNSGVVRIVIGSVQKLGTGVNFQKRLKAIHLITIPWRPCDYDQCIGRIVRPGNIYSEVDIFFYSTLETPDAARFEILKNKQHFINQISENISFSGNTISESAADADDIDYNKMMAMITGNRTVIQLVETQEKYNQLSASLYYKISDMNNAKRMLTESEKGVRQYTDRIALIQKTIDLIGDDMPILDKVTYQTHDGQEYKIKDFGAYVQRLVTANVIRSVTTIAAFGDKFIVQLLPPNAVGENYRIQSGVKGDDGNISFTITYNRGEIVKTTQLLGENPVKAIHNIPVALALNNDKLAQQMSEYEQAKKTVDAVSSDEIELLQREQVHLAQQLSKLKNQLVSEKATLIDESTRIRYKNIKNSTFTEAQESLTQGDSSINKTLKIVM